jgi:DNA-binding Lrp family transcriptional regulator
MRRLSEKDIEILKKLAPEIESRTRVEYRSILPPVSMHFAVDEEDFSERLKRLERDDISYLADRILDGSECLLCITPEYARAFLEALDEKLSSEKTEQIRELYKSSTGYDA